MVLRCLLAATVLIEGLGAAPVWAGVPYDFPPPEEVPEEVLRLDAPGYAVSPVTGERLSLGDYARLQVELQEAQTVRPQVSQQLQNLIFLLRVRKLLRTFVPFIP